MSDTTETTPATEPIVTMGIILLLAVIFVAQLSGATMTTDHGNNIRVPDLVAFGAMNPDLVHIGGDWWRLATAPLLHAGWLHFILNAVALYFAGNFIEQHLGGATVSGILALGALAGAFSSYVIGGPQLVSVGASGGIMSLLAAALTLCYMLPEAKDTISGKSLFARILIPSLIPTSSGVDYAAHFGGAIMGGGIALLLADITYLQRENPHRRAVALTATWVFVGVALFGAVRLVQAAPVFNPEWRLMKRGEDQRLIGTPEPDARVIAEQFPGDPQAHLVLSVALYNAGKPVEAGEEAMKGLRLTRTIGFDSGSYNYATIPQLRMMIALGEAASNHRGRAAMLADDKACLEYESAFGKKLVKLASAATLCAGR
jgi:rhomboid protease GluP